MNTPSPLTLSEYRQEFKRLYRFLKHKMQINLLIPLGTKNPLYKHARDKWNWKLVNSHYERTGLQVDKGVGLLLKDLAVLDLDTLEEVDHWETEWPVLNDVPMETTSKGKHYFFLRTPLCDKLGLTDGPLSRTSDFKSITATGTAGAILSVKLLES